MMTDPVVEEMRRHGAVFAEECGGDIHRMAEQLRREEASHADHLVDRSTSPGQKAESRKPRAES